MAVRRGHNPVWCGRGRHGLGGISRRKHHGMVWAHARRTPVWRFLEEATWCATFSLSCFNPTLLLLPEYRSSTRAKDGSSVEKVLEQNQHSTTTHTTTSPFLGVAAHRFPHAFDFLPLCILVSALSLLVTFTSRVSE